MNVHTSVIFLSVTFLLAHHTHQHMQILNAVLVRPVCVCGWMCACACKMFVKYHVYDMCFRQRAHEHPRTDGQPSGSSRSHSLPGRS